MPAPACCWRPRARRRLDLISDSIFSAYKSDPHIPLSPSCLTPAFHTHALQRHIRRVCPCPMSSQAVIRLEPSMSRWHFQVSDVMFPRLETIMWAAPYALFDYYMSLCPVVASPCSALVCLDDFMPCLYEDEPPRACAGAPVR